MAERSKVDAQRTPNTGGVDQAQTQKGGLLLLDAVAGQLTRGTGAHVVCRTIIAH